MTYPGEILAFLTSPKAACESVETGARYRDLVIKAMEYLPPLIAQSVLEDLADLDSAPTAQPDTRLVRLIDLAILRFNSLGEDGTAGWFAKQLGSIRGRNAEGTADASGATQLPNEVAAQLDIPVGREGWVNVYEDRLSSLFESEEYALSVRDTCPGNKYQRTAIFREVVLPLSESKQDQA